MGGPIIDEGSKVEHVHVHCMYRLTVLRPAMYVHCLPDQTAAGVKLLKLKNVDIPLSFSAQFIYLFIYNLHDQLQFDKNSNIYLTQPTSAGTLTDQSTLSGYSEGISVYEQISAKDNKIVELSEEVVALKRQVWDLEEGLKEKDEVISAKGLDI